MQTVQESNTPLTHVLCMKEVTQICKRSRSSIYQDIAKGTFPKPLKMGASIRWLESDINAWLEDLIAQRGEA